MKLYIDESYTDELRGHRRYDLIFDLISDGNYTIDYDNITIANYEIINGYIEIICEISNPIKKYTDLYAELIYNGETYTMCRKPLNSSIVRFYYLFDNVINDVSNINIMYK